MPAEVVALYPVHEPVRLRAPAKVNLFIDVLDRRPDGYHNVDAVNVSVDLFDEIELVLNDTGYFALECDWEGVPTGDENLLVQAARLMLKGTRWGAELRLSKNIPVGAGLGGGSTDAAALMRYLSRVFNLGERNLLPKAIQIGSDVPYSVVGGPARIGGRGDTVSRLSDVPSLRLALVDPICEIKTETIYAHLPPSDDREHPRADCFIESWRRGDLRLLGPQMFNAFQGIVFDQVPRLAQLRDVLLSHGCLGACLTGTGSHLVGLLGAETPGPGEWDWEETDAEVREVRTLSGDFPGWIKRR